VRIVSSVRKKSVTHWNGQDSGHGNQVTCKHHTETDGKDEVIYAYTGRYIVDNVRLPHTMFLDFGLIVHSQKLRKALVDPLPRGSKLFVSECSKSSCNASSLFWDTGTVGLLPL
jgi:hypothetical protein